MKHQKASFIFLMMSCLFFISCHSTIKSVPSDNQNEYSLSNDTLTSSKNKGTAAIKLIDSITFNFGTIKAGDTVTHTFHFKNIGKIPLIISSATASCGCTVPHFNKRPILPNQTDSIITVFVSKKDGTGFQNKVVTVNYNSPQSPKLLTLYGRVN